jgi:hypothetical protein
LSVFTPIPFTNFLPAVAICIMAIGVLERDGIWILVGVLVGTVGMTLTVSIIWTLMAAMLAAF